VEKLAFRIWRQWVQHSRERVSLDVCKYYHPTHCKWVNVVSGPFDKYKADTLQGIKQEAYFWASPARLFYYFTSKPGTEECVGIMHHFIFSRGHLETLEKMLLHQIRHFSLLFMRCSCAWKWLTICWPSIIISVYSAYTWSRDGLSSKCSIPLSPGEQYFSVIRTGYILGPAKESWPVWKMS